MEKRTLGLGAFKQLISYGFYIGDTELAIVTCRLYKDALAPSTKTTYATGINHLRNFPKQYDKVSFPSDIYKPASRLSILLSFFAAYLFEKDSIRTHSTIRNYMSQVKQFYLKRGYPKKMVESELLKTVMKSIKRCMPPKTDTRSAFLFLHYTPQEI